MEFSETIPEWSGQTFLDHGVLAYECQPLIPGKNQSSFSKPTRSILEVERPRSCDDEELTTAKSQLE